MDLTDLTDIARDDLNAENNHLRRSIYTEFTNSTSPKTLCTGIVKKFVQHTRENLLPCNYESDILYSFFKEDKIPSTLKPVRGEDLELVCSSRRSRNDSDLYSRDYRIAEKFKRERDHRKMPSLSGRVPDRLKPTNASNLDFDKKFEETRESLTEFKEIFGIDDDRFESSMREFKKKKQRRLFSKIIKSEMYAKPSSPSTSDSEDGISHKISKSKSSDKTPDKLESSSTVTSDSDLLADLGDGITGPMARGWQHLRQYDDADDFWCDNKYRKMLKYAGVKLLIFTNKSVCKQLAKYLGLIYLEDILTEAQEDMFKSRFKCNKNYFKYCPYIQSYIKKKLLSGCHDIVLTHTLYLWDTIDANYKAVISDRNDFEEMLLYVKAKFDTNFHIELGEDPHFLQYLEAVTLIINKILRGTFYTITGYRCEDFGEDSYYNLKLSIIAVVPFYILCYLFEYDSVDDYAKVIKFYDPKNENTDDEAWG